MNFGIDDQTIKQFHEVFARFPEINEVVIYGSRAKGNHREGSDIHLTMNGENLNENMLSKVSIELDAQNMPYLIDLSVFTQLTSANLIDHIKRVGKVFYTTDDKNN